jgi:hypothetical protein
MRRLKRELGSGAVRQRFRVPAPEFTRERGLTWPVVILLRVRGQKVAVQTAGKKFLSAVGEVWRVVTARAYGQARHQVQPEVFVPLNAVTCEEYDARYGADGEVGGWHGQRVGGGDGRYLNRPATAETRRELSGQTHQYEGGAQVQALAAVLSELRNESGLRAAWGPKPAEKNLLVGTHLAAPQAGDVRVGDRASADYRVLVTGVARGWHFVIGFPRQSFTAVTAVWAAPAQERVVTLEGTAKARASGAAPQLPTTLRVRVLKVGLARGEGEVLGTALLAAQPSPAVECKAV